MSLANVLRQDLQSRNQCSVAKIRLSLDKDDAAALDEALAKVNSLPSSKRSSGENPYTSVWLVRVLKDSGFEISRDAIRRHLRGECGCASV